MATTPEVEAQLQAGAGVAIGVSGGEDSSAVALRLADHLKARPYKPKDKAKAEAGVLLVERWILARLRHRTFFSLAELNAAIRELLTDLNQWVDSARCHNRNEPRFRGRAVTLTA